MNSASQINLNFHRKQSFENQAIDIALEELQSFSEEILNTFLEYYGKSYTHSQAWEIKINLNIKKFDFSYENKKKILSCIPKFVNEEVRFELLKLEMLYFIAFSSQEYFNVFKTIDIEDINKFFWGSDWDSQQILKFKSNWFVKDAYDDKEIEEISLAYQFILQHKLVASYDNIYIDIENLIPKIQYFNTNILHKNIWENDEGDFSAFYTAKFLGIELYIPYLANQILKLEFEALNKYRTSNPKIEVQINSIPEFKGNFKKQLEALTINELAIIENEKKVSEANMFLFDKDWQTFIRQYQTLKSAGNQTHLKANFSLKGGNLRIDLNIKSKLTRTINRIFIGGGLISFAYLACVVLINPYWSSLFIPMLVAFILLLKKVF